RQGFRLARIHPPLQRRRLAVRNQERQDRPRGRAQGRGVEEVQALSAGAPRTAPLAGAAGLAPAGSRPPSRTHSFFTACPPNSLRIADRIRSANDSPSRERNRAIRDWVITGAGTSRSIASATVQRPSPESGTNGAMPSIVGFLSSASAVRSSSHERTTLPW